MSEWGDPKGFKPMMEYIQDVKNNEQSRMDACAALAWVATDEDMLTVAKKIDEYTGTLKSDQFRRMCLLETLITRPVPGTAPALIGLINKDSLIETRHQLARAIGKAGLSEEVTGRLFEMMKDEALVNDAALALLLGGTPDVAARAVAMYGTLFGDKSKPALEELQELWYRTFGYWSKDDLEKGRIFKWVDNAMAVSHVEINQTPQEWAPALLTKQFDNLLFDNGPHSFTRVVLRSRLYQMAKGTDAPKREGAIRTLEFMQEQGVLLALRDEEGPAGKLGREAYHRLLNPKVIAGMIKIDEEKYRMPDQ
jgi:HEAT repeat protein